jgi:site-specific DNA-cytosine methylase
VRIQVIDLFCGAGGLSAGFRSASNSSTQFDVVAGIDWDEKSLLTYRRNLGVDGIRADLSDTAISERVAEALCKKLCLGETYKIEHARGAKFRTGFALGSDALMGDHR